MKNSKHYSMTFVGAWTVLITLLTVQAQSQELGKTRGPYVNFGIGPNIMSTEIGADPGVRFSAELGYNFNRWVGLEAETGYIYNSFTRKEGASRYLGQVPLLVNVVLRYENQWRLVPYVGFGLGVDYRYDDRGGGLEPVYQPKFGLRYGLTDNISVGIGYKYLGFTLEPLLIHDFTGRHTTLGNHSVMAELDYKF